MEVAQEELENIREKILEHIKENYPADKAKEFIEKIAAMNPEEFIGFLKTQGILKEGEEASSQKCAFCSMVFGEIPTTKIGENEKAIAVLEINPISEGHTIVIPKEHIEDPNSIPEEAKLLSREIGERIGKALKPKEINFTTTSVMGHQIINVIPVYEGETIESARTKKTPEELLKIKEKLNPKKEKPKEELEEKKVKEIDEKNTWLPRKRLP